MEDRFYKLLCMLSLVHFTSTVNNFQHNKMVIGIWSPSDKENMVFSMSEIGGKVFYYNDSTHCATGIFYHVKLSGAGSV